MRLFDANTARRKAKSATPIFVGVEANEKRQTVVAASPWRRSIRATGAFLLFVVIAGGVMLIHNPTGAESGSALEGSPPQKNTTTTPQSQPKNADSPNAYTGATAQPSQPDATSSSSSSVSVTTTSDSSGTPSTTLSINGQDVSVPANGSTQRTQTNAGGTVSVTVSNSSDTNTGEASNSSTNTSVNVVGNTFSAESNISQTYSSGGGNAY